MRGNPPVSRDAAWTANRTWNQCEIWHSDEKQASWPPSGKTMGGFTLGRQNFVERAVEPDGGELVE